jgi:hypothetical protein
LILIGPPARIALDGWPFAPKAGLSARPDRYVHALRNWFHFVPGSLSMTVNRFGHGDVLSATLGSRDIGKWNLSWTAPDESSRSYRFSGEPEVVCDDDQFRFKGIAEKK